MIASKISISRLKNLFGLGVKKKTNIDVAPIGAAVDEVVQSLQPANEIVALNDITILSKRNVKGMTGIQLRNIPAQSLRK